MVAVIIGFVIALLTALTGVGGGSFTTPALVMLFAMPAGEAVGTALVFSAVLKLIAAPVIVAARTVHGQTLKRMLVGGVPGLLAGSYALRRFDIDHWKPYVLMVIGAVIAASAAVSVLRGLRPRPPAVERRRLIPWLTLPIGFETGFSSAGAGALGTLVLFNYAAVSPAQVVGTDLLFGAVVATAGAALHLGWGTVSSAVLTKLLIGGIPGIMIGTYLSRRVPGERLRKAVLVLALILGVQLVVTGWQSAVPSGFAFKLITPAAAHK